MIKIEPVVTSGFEKGMSYIPSLIVIILWTLWYGGIIGLVAAIAINSGIRGSIARNEKIIRGESPRSSMESHETLRIEMGDYKRAILRMWVLFGLACLLRLAI